MIELSKQHPLVVPFDGITGPYDMLITTFQSMES